LGELIETGQIKPAVHRTYPLGDVATAIRDLIDGHARGKIVSTV
jgi:NADPH:quinone reductase-like Zn-dependent oxidoreductase